MLFLGHPASQVARSAPITLSASSGFHPSAHGECRSHEWWGANRRASCSPRQQCRAPSQRSGQPTHHLTKTRAVVGGEATVASTPPGTKQTLALIFDCDGVILESEDLHRQAYNAAFDYFDVKCADSGSPVNWSEAYYEQLQNSIGGGKQKMRWHFGQNGWPHSTILKEAPTTPEEEAALIDSLQDWKTLHYQKMVGSGAVPARPGVLTLMDEARSAGLRVGVCSASTKSSAIVVLEGLLGKARFQALDVFMAGDDVERKKPDPLIYQKAAQRLGLDPAHCLVIEDSTIGLQAAMGAGMRCIITYTPSTADQDFQGAELVVENLESGFKGRKVTLAALLEGLAGDDRK